MKRVPTGVSIEVFGDRVMVKGPKAVLAKAVDFSLLNYMAWDDMIEFELWDYIPYRGRQIANAKIHSTCD